MIKAFLSGSRSIDALSEAVRGRLDRILEEGATILVGDAQGADKAFQRYLADQGYERVVVYCSGNRRRNNVANWETANIPVEPGLKGREFYAVKDREMARDADRGLILWDGKSLGSIQNAIELLERGKPSTVFLPDDRDYSVSARPVRARPRDFWKAASTGSERGRTPRRSSSGPSVFDSRLGRRSVNSWSASRKWRESGGSWC